MGRYEVEEGISSYLKDKIGYWKLKEETLECALWRTCFGRGYGPVIRKTTIHTHTPA
jgi:hypothetical protein